MRGIFASKGRGFRHPEGVTLYLHAQRAGDVSTPLSFSYEKESAVDGRKKEWQRGDFDFPPLQSPLKRPRRGLRPPSWVIPGVWFVQKRISNRQNAMQMRIRQTGEVVEILCVSFDFHTSNIQRAQTKRFVRFIVRSGNPILRSPEGRSLT